MKEQMEVTGVGFISVSFQFHFSFVSSGNRTTAAKGRDGNEHRTLQGYAALLPEGQNEAGGQMVQTWNRITVHMQRVWEGRGGGVALGGHSGGS